MDRIEVFKDELNYINDFKIKTAAKILLTHLPDYFFHVAASSSGKYHPVSDLGEGGLIRHTKSVVRIGYELLNLEMYQNIFSSYEKDLIIFSLMFHDGMKQGEASLENNNTHTLFEHPLIMANYIKNNKEVLLFNDDDINFIYECISSHMGQWNQKDDKTLPKPIKEHQRFVHLCDYIASRSFINIDYDDNNKIIERRKL